MKLPAKYMFTFAKETCKRTFRFSNFISRTPFFIEHLPWLLLNLYEYRRTYLARKSFFFQEKLAILQSVWQKTLKTMRMFI